MTQTQYDLKLAYQRMRDLEQAQFEAMAAIAACFFLAGLFVADVMLGFALSDPIIEGFHEITNNLSQAVAFIGEDLKQMERGL